MKSYSVRGKEKVKERMRLSSFRLKNVDEKKGSDRSINNNKGFLDVKKVNGDVNIPSLPLQNDLKIPQNCNSPCKIGKEVSGGMLTVQSPAEFGQELRRPSLLSQVYKASPK